MFTLNNPLSLNDWFLFLIGFVAAVIAFVTSYKMDDAYPGYGKIHRQLNETEYSSIIDHFFEYVENYDFETSNFFKISAFKIKMDEGIGIIFKCSQ